MDIKNVKSSEQPSLLLAEQKLNKEHLLVESIKNLQVPFWFERSCKITEKNFHINRFIYCVDKNSLGRNTTEKIIDICCRLGMPHSLLDSFQKIIPAISFVYFGFEEGESTCGYKVYGEFVVDKKSIPKLKEPFLGALGFKWDAFNPAKHMITKYTCFPALSSENIHERIADIFQSRNCQLLLEANKDILDCALEKITLDGVIYLEVADENGPRRSFDFNVYDARLQMENINHAIIKIFQHFSIPKNIYTLSNTASFGHISGGVDREGKAFITIYGGLKKHENDNAKDSAKKNGEN